MIVKTKNKKGSVLVFTLFIMMLTLITGISIITVTLAGRKSTLSSGKSVNSFQIADSGLEAVLVGMKDPTATDINSIIPPTATECNSDGEIVDDDISGGNYVVSFYTDVDDDTTKTSSCSYLIDDPADPIVRVKSVGVYKNTTRSVETTLGP